MPETAKNPLILVVEDQANHRKVLKGFLESKGWRAVLAKDADEARKVLKKKEKPAVVLSDLKMPGTNGIELLRELKLSFAGLPVVLMTAYGTVESAVEAMKLGASDFLAKPLDFVELERVLKKTLDSASREGDEWISESGEGEHPLIGQSAAMEAVYKLISKAGPSDASVLVLGETGTGKELVASAVHAASGRRDQPFIKVHCGAIPEDLLEAELFGYEKGAFTGAVREKPGKFELADGGTVFLDEVGDMSAAMQVKLLRVLQSGEFDRVGGTGTLTVDVRVVSATNVDLEKAVEEKRFREDLFYRLNIVPISVPPLRERREDIPELVSFFLERLAAKNGLNVPGLEPAALDALVNSPWPGNVRQLENLLERTLVLLEGDTVRPEDLPLKTL